MALEAFVIRIPQWSCLNEVPYLDCLNYCWTQIKKHAQSTYQQHVIIVMKYWKNKFFLGNIPNLYFYWQPSDTAVNKELLNFRLNRFSPIWLWEPLGIYFEYKYTELKIIIRMSFGQTTKKHKVHTSCDRYNSDKVQYRKK